jgi:16S rRNA (guanine966-N2)-methyltransferase
MIESRFDLAEYEVFDLFAGTGALGIEALSRGATRAVFVDSRPESVDLIRRNLVTLHLLQRSKVLRMDALDFVRRMVDDEGTSKPRIFFCDPPYDFTLWRELLDGISSGIVVVESNREIEPSARWNCIKAKSYGDTVIQLLRVCEPSDIVTHEEAE